MWNIKVLVEESKQCGHGVNKVWRSVRPTNGQPYQYETKEEALRMANMCYGHGEAEVKVTNEAIS